MRGRFCICLLAILFVCRFDQRAAWSGVQPSPNPDAPQPTAAPATSSQAAVAPKELVHPDHPVVLVVPDRWERTTALVPPILLAGVEPGTGNSLGLLGFKAPDETFTMNRKAAETGLLKEAGPKCKILHRLDTKLVGLPAYCIIAEMQVQEMKLSVARIMMEKPLNGFLYVVQYSKLSPGNLSPKSIPSIVARVQLKK